ncbi:MAG: DNA-processing protein DprA, partial [Endomicrobia bacterium]|nr:DNA-processing protein DprA [Endomicrobiia bacterium]
TIAVLGNGLGVYYPLPNKKLQQRIPSYGAVITEFPYFYKPTKTSFPQRNRIVAALSLGTVVIEADLNSGAMITAKFALELGKDVFAVPGSIFSKQSRGTNLLIKTGAKLVTSGDDIIEEIHNLAELLKEQVSKKKVKSIKEYSSNNTSDLSDDMKKVLDVILSEPGGIHIDKLQNITNFEITKLLNLIFQLEIKSKIKELPGKIYVAI